jgi:hypothetical protein
MRRGSSSWQHERHATVGFGDRRDPAGGISHHRVVKRPDAGEHLQCVERRGRLALGGADVGLEPVPESAIGVAVGAKRVEDRCDRCAVQQHCQPVAVEHAGVGEDEPLSGVDVDRVHADATLRVPR